jgi:hypothetical protein
MKAALRVLISDDQEVIREAFAVILNAQPDIDVIAEAGDGRSAVVHHARHGEESPRHQRSDLRTLMHSVEFGSTRLSGSTPVASTCAQPVGYVLDKVRCTSPRTS